MSAIRAPNELLIRSLAIGIVFFKVHYRLSENLKSGRRAFNVKRNCDPLSLASLERSLESPDDGVRLQKESDIRVTAPLHVRNADSVAGMSAASRYPGRAISLSLSLPSYL